MTKEEYIKQKEEITKNFNSQISVLNEQYIRTYAQFDIGQKVIVNEGRKDERQAIIVGYEIWLDCVLPVVTQIKKDGTAYKYKFKTMLYPSDTITLIN